MKYRKTNCYVLDKTQGERYNNFNKKLKEKLIKARRGRIYIWT